MSGDLKPGELQKLTEKLRAITDQSWSRRGSQLCAGPMSMTQASRTVGNLVNFDIQADKNVGPNTASLSIPLNEAREALANVGISELRKYQVH